MLTLNLKRLFKARSIKKPYTYLVKNGFTRFTAHKIANNKGKSIFLAHIERLCLILKCTPNDLFEYTPGSDNRADEPLNILKKQNEYEDISTLITDLPLNKVNEIAQIIKEKKKEFKKI